MPPPASRSNTSQPHPQSREVSQRRWGEPTSHSSAQAAAPAVPREVPRGPRSGEAYPPAGPRNQQSAHQSEPTVAVNQLPSGPRGSERYPQPSDLANSQAYQKRDRRGRLEISSSAPIPPSAPRSNAPLAAPRGPSRPASPLRGMAGERPRPADEQDPWSRSDSRKPSHTSNAAVPATRVSQGQCLDC